MQVRKQSDIPLRMKNCEWFTGLLHALENGYVPFTLFTLKGAPEFFFSVLTCSLIHGADLYMNNFISRVNMYTESIGGLWKNYQKYR